MKSFVALFLLVGVASGIPQNFFAQEWETYKVKFGKTYSSPIEEQIRRRIYIENKLEIESHNQDYYSGLVSYETEINQFTDMLKSEIINPQTAYRSSSANRGGVSYIPPPDDVEIPQSIDWRKKGAVTPVHKQGLCDVNWGYAATGSLEGQQFRKTGKLVGLSTQQLVDCMEGKTCSGKGDVEDAFEYIKKNKGVDTEASYPFTGRHGDCLFKNKTVAATVSGYVRLAQNEDELMKAVATIGPIAVGINGFGLACYKNGVFKSEECMTDVINHHVLVVGYNTTADGEDFWIVKNSWGIYWGMKGYFYLARGGNWCRITTDMLYPLV